MAGNNFYRINHFIKAGLLRVIDDQGKQIGILTLSDALKKAREEEKDLVEIAPKANPPVAKIIDFQKFKYLEEKKKRKEKKSRGGETKGVRLTPFIAEGDIAVRAKRTREFLKEGNKVRVEVRFKGRQMIRKDIGYEVLSKFAADMAEGAKVEQEPRWFGKSLMMTLSPTKQTESKNEKKDENKTISQPSLPDHEKR